MELTSKEMDAIIGIQYKIQVILAAACNRNGVTDLAGSDEPILNALCRITTDCEEIKEQNEQLINKI